MNRKGITLIEMILASAVGAAVLLVATSYMTRAGRSTEESMRKRADDFNLLQASNQIVQTARFAGGSGCSRPAAGTLECFVDRTMPATGALKRVRFALRANSLVYEERNGAAWVTMQTYPNVTAFDICTPAEVAADTCALEPRAMNRAFGSVANATVAYMRFRLRRAPPPGSPMGDAAAEIQSGFFARNTAQLAPGLAFQFGGTIR